MTSFPGPGHRYDVAIVGGGIAGGEAAYAAASAGLDVLLVTTSLDSVYMLGHARQCLKPPEGTLMAELHGELADETGQVDRWELHRAAKYRLEMRQGIHLLQSNVTELVSDEGASSGVPRVTGVRTWEGVERRAERTVLCVGSFLRSRLNQGRLQEVAGRLGEMSYDELYRDLEARGFDFETVSRELAERGDLPYRVEFRVLGRSEQGADGYSLPRLQGLYGAGLCLRPELDYEGAARDGLSLALALAGQG